MSESLESLLQVCRDDETNESKGCGYVTLGSIYSARNAVAILDGSVSTLKLSLPCLY